MCVYTIYGLGFDLSIFLFPLSSSYTFSSRFINHLFFFVLGVYENLVASPHGAPSHALRYTFDGQPIGAFQPWIQYTDESQGCVIGRGGDYYGPQNISSNTAACLDWKKRSSGPYILKRLEEPCFNVTFHGHVCRNPNLDPNGVWCYSTKNYDVDYCRVQHCFDYKGVFKR